MATIRERKKNDGSKTYQVQIRLRGEKPIAATFNRKSDAKNWIQDTESAIREGRFFPKSESQRRSVAEVIDRFLNETLPSRPKFRHEYKSQLLFWKKELGHLRLSDLSKAEIAAGRDHLLKTITRRHTPMSPATVNRHLAALSSAIRVAIDDWGWLEKNPVKHVKKLKEPKGRSRFLSNGERNRLFEACRKSPNQDLLDVVMLAITTGARRMEIWSLKWQDIDLTNRLITFRYTKNGEIRGLPLNREAYEIFYKRSKIRRLDTSLIFPSKKDPDVPMDFRAPFERALKEASIEDFRWHDLRHSCASYLAQKGVPILTIAEILGHVNTAVTVRYSHLNQDYLKNSLAEIDKILSG